ncbi:hypothetical protein HU200_062429 [Digitaria exilis]|uniref:Uncharacterized protein n=1 Tax=Digitaria exilis TaxID=1010633 RepID=A0A835A2X6_9POAL|nr:hypothetical protein HU200_062429 [Digitaria exilis]
MAQAVKDTELRLEEDLVFNLCKPELRGNALAELAKVPLLEFLCMYHFIRRFGLDLKRETFNDLALLLWYSFGTIAALLQEIVAVYPALSPPTLLASAASRACNAIALLQTVAAHPETRTPFLQGNNHKSMTLSMSEL